MYLIVTVDSTVTIKYIILVESVEVIQVLSRNLHLLRKV